MLQRTAPSDPEQFRRSLYEGAIYLLPRTAASRRLTETVWGLLEGELGQTGPVRTAHERVPDTEFFQAVGRLRKVFYEQERFFHAMGEVAAEFGLRPEEQAFDPLRLRVSKHNGHLNPLAAPVYYTHRDTWYSHPQCQISWWIPLHDVVEAETFVFFPDYFTQGVENDSGAFDYDTWTQDRRSLRIGWQDREAGKKALYPAYFGELPGARRVPFSAQAGDLLVFAGSHLHQTLNNTTGKTRFSMDFRTVHLPDHAAGLGAPNVDNRSTGSALVDYFHPREPAAA